MVTTSTSSWVAARSGADSQTKLTQDTSPAPPVRISAASRWNLAWLAAPIAHAAPSSHSMANAGSMLDQRGVTPIGALVAASAAGQQRHQDDQQQLRLQPAAGEEAIQRARQASR